MKKLTMPHFKPVTSRRDFLANAGSGFGAFALGSLLAADGYAAAVKGKNPLAPKPPHFPPKAKSVIFLFMEGGPSHIDLFDPKPDLKKLAGQPLPPSFGKVITAMGTSNNALMPSQRTFKQYGQSGQWVSDWYPHIAQHMDDICCPAVMPGGRIEPRRLGLSDEYRVDSGGTPFAGFVG